VGSRHPLWEERLDEGGRSILSEGPALDEKGEKETVESSPLDSRLTDVLRMPEDTYYPFLHALAVMLTFYGLLLRSHRVAGVGLLLVALLTAGWLWPARRELREEE